MKKKLRLKKTRIFMLSSLGLILILGLSLGLGLKHKNGGSRPVPAPTPQGIPSKPETPTTPIPKPSLYPGAKRTLTVTSNFTNMSFAIFYMDYQGHNGIDALGKNHVEINTRGQTAHTADYIDSTKWSKDQIASQSTNSIIPEIYSYPGNVNPGANGHIHDWYCNFKFIPKGQQGGGHDKTIPVDVNRLYIFKTTVIDGNTNLVISFYAGDKYVDQRMVPEG